MVHVLVALQDDAQRKRILNYLEPAADLEVHQTANPQGILSAIQGYPRMDVVLVSPDGLGLDALQKSTLLEQPIPFIVIARVADPAVMERAFRRGVFDYFVEPIQGSELVQSLLRAGALRAHLQRLHDAGQSLLGMLAQFHSATAGELRAFPPEFERGDSGTLSVGDLRIDRRRDQVSIRGVNLKLTPTEFGILKMLAERAGEAVTFEELALRVQGVDLARDEARKTLSAHLSNLRGKLRDAGAEWLLTNLRGRGYTLDPGYSSVAQGDSLRYLLKQITNPNLVIAFWQTDRTPTITDGVFSRSHPFGELKLRMDGSLEALYGRMSPQVQQRVINAHIRALQGEVVEFDDRPQESMMVCARIEPLWDGDHKIVGCQGAAIITLPNEVD